MSDPLEPLRHVDEVSGPAPLPAAEVRRRGDRMRRRRTTLRALGAACAVAVVVTGGVALGSGRPDAAPPLPAASGTGTPTPDWTLGPSPSPDGPAPGGGQALTVPRNFPLLAGVPDVDGDSRREPAVTDPSTPRVFDPCHNNEQAAVDEGRTDYRQVTQTGPASSYVRELVVYEDSSAAHVAMLLAKGELERCPQYLYDDGISRDVWEPSTVSSEKPPADDVVLAVNHGYADYGVTTLATNWMVMRVGNAILTLAYDGEFGASKESVRRVATDELGSYIVMAPAMCPFADETTDIGCAEPSTAAGPGPVTDPGPATLLDEETLRDQTGIDGFRTVPDAQTATLPCQAEWLTTFHPDTADYRQFEARGDDGQLGAWAGTAVLSFPDELAAGTAYDTVGEWLSQCEPQVDPSHRLVAAVDSGIGEPHITRLDDGVMSWRAIKLSAPERCVECDAAWDDHEGLVQVGRHLVLVHVALGGDMQFGVDDTRLSLNGLLEAAAGRVREHAGDAPSGGASDGAGDGAGNGTQGTPLLGPDGYGPVRLGMSAAEAENTGIITLEDSHGDGCTAFGLLSDDRKRILGTGYLAPEKGVVAIVVNRGIETPQGIHVGSGVTAVKRAYAHLTGDGAWTTAPASDTAEYVMRFEGEKVAELALATTGQDCFG